MATTASRAISVQMVIDEIGCEENLLSPSGMLPADEYASLKKKYEQSLQWGRTQQLKRKPKQENMFSQQVPKPPQVPKATDPIWLAPDFEAPSTDFPTSSSTRYPSYLPQNLQEAYNRRFYKDDRDRERYKHFEDSGDAPFIAQANQSAVDEEVAAMLVHISEYQRYATGVLPSSISESPTKAAEDTHTKSNSLRTAARQDGATKVRKSVKFKAAYPNSLSDDQVGDYISMVETDVFYQQPVSHFSDDTLVSPKTPLKPIIAFGRDMKKRMSESRSKQNTST